jgi:hypothetical protein
MVTIKHVTLLLHTCYAADHFEGVALGTEWTASWWHPWCAETCRRLTNFWRAYILVHVKLILFSSYMLGASGMMIEKVACCRKYRRNLDLVYSALIFHFVKAKMQIYLSVCFRYNEGLGCIAGCLAKMAQSWKACLPVVTVLNSELLLDRLNKMRAFLCQGSVLHRPSISAQLYHVDQGIRLRCIVSIWLPWPESIHFLRTLGNWFLDGNISVCLYRCTVLSEVY